MDDLASYLAERDEMLRALDVDRFHAFHRKHDLPMPPGGWADPVMVPLIMMHKSRLQVTTMSADEKRVSREWLLSRGYTLPPEVAIDETETRGNWPQAPTPKGEG